MVDKYRVKNAGWSHNTVSTNAGMRREDLQRWGCVLRVGESGGVERCLFESWVV